MRNICIPFLLLVFVFSSKISTAQTTLTKNQSIFIPAKAHIPDYGIGYKYYNRAEASDNFLRFNVNDEQTTYIKYTIIAPENSGYKIEPNYTVINPDIIVEVYIDGLLAEEMNIQNMGTVKVFLSEGDHEIKYLFKTASSNTLTLHGMNYTFQENEEGKQFVGSVTQFTNYLKSNPSSLFIGTEEHPITTIENNESHWKGSFNNQRGSVFLINLNNNVLIGNLILSAVNDKYYKISAVNEHVYLIKTPIHEFICNDYHKTTNSEIKTNNTKGATTKSTGQDLALQSRPGSQNIFYLNFDGYDLPKDCYWNNGNAMKFNAFEGGKESIEEIFSIVKEDYAPFNCNITTDSTLFNATNSFNRLMIVISKDRPEEEAITANKVTLGTAVQECFYEQTIRAFTPAIQVLAFSSNAIGNISNYEIGNTISHEIGHTLGLKHDGFIANPAEDNYYQGHYDWGPIMGSPESDMRSVIQFSKGEYPTANNLEDDLAIIASHLGYAPHTDNHSFENAQSLSMEGDTKQQSFNQDATTIQTATVADFYKFEVPYRGTLDILSTNIASSTAGAPNLSFRCSLFDSNRNLIVQEESIYSDFDTGTDSDTDSDGQSVSKEIRSILNPIILSKYVEAGSYYLKIESTAHKTLADGWSNYGAVGEYKLEGHIRKTQGDLLMEAQNGITYSDRSRIEITFETPTSSCSRGAFRCLGCGIMKNTKSNNEFIVRRAFTSSDIGEPELSSYTTIYNGPLEDLATIETNGLEYVKYDCTIDRPGVYWYHVVLVNNESETSSAHEMYYSVKYTLPPPIVEHDNISICAGNPELVSIANTTDDRFFLEFTEIDESGTELLLDESPLIDGRLSEGEHVYKVKQGYIYQADHTADEYFYSEELTIAVNVTAASPPIITFGGEFPICFGQEILEEDFTSLVTFAPNHQLQWKRSGDMVFGHFSPLATSVPGSRSLYVRTINNETRCTSEPRTIPLSIKPNYHAPIVETIDPFCQGSGTRVIPIVSLNETEDGEHSFAWRYSNQANFRSLSSENDLPLFSVISGIIQYEVVEMIEGCQSQITPYEFEVIPTPTKPSIVNSLGNELCENILPFSFITTFPSNDNYRFNWYKNGSLVRGNYHAVLNLSDAGLGHDVYQVKYIDDNGCQSPLSNQEVIDVFPTPRSLSLDPIDVPWICGDNVLFDLIEPDFGNEIIWTSTGTSTPPIILSGDAGSVQYQDFRQQNAEGCLSSSSRLFLNTVYASGSESGNPISVYNNKFISTNYRDPACFVNFESTSFTVNIPANFGPFAISFHQNNPLAYVEGELQVIREDGTSMILEQGFGSNFYLINETTNSQTLHITIISEDLEFIDGISFHQFSPYKSGIATSGRAQDNVISGCDRVQNRIYAEYYDEGGQGVSFFDSEIKNTGYGFRGGSNTWVDTYKKGSNITVGNFQPGEWLNYSIDFRDQSYYKLNLRYSKYKNVPVSFDVYIDGDLVVSDWNLPYTGSNPWSLTERINETEFYVSLGKHIVTVSINHVFNDDAVNFDFLEFQRQSCSSARKANIGQSVVTTDELEQETEITSSSLLINQEFKAFPNPTTGLVQLQLGNNGGAKELSIINSLGQTVSKTTTFSSNFSWNLSHLSPGVYQIIYREADEELKSKLIIAK